MEFKHLGPYEIGDPLGRGGMGTVYRAVQTETRQIAAVKVLAPHTAQAEGFRERFEAEIESLKKLRHNNIVRLYGYGEEQGFAFYAMELVEGTSLEEEIIAGRRFHWREVIEFGVQICRALKHAHDHGVIHRDIKPANLLLNQAGQIKIADFGIARLFGNTKLTSSGGVLGTADYMAPEQAAGQLVTEKCDQYSLGGVMYALLAGRPPFRADSLPEMLQLQRFAEPEPVRQFAPRTPEQLERLIMQLLAKDPDDRFPNALVLARHMEAMNRALSRPVEDGFTLQHEDETESGHRYRPNDEQSIVMDVTRVEENYSDVTEESLDLKAVPPSRSDTPAVELDSSPSKNGGATNTGEQVVGSPTSVGAIVSGTSVANVPQGERNESKPGQNRFTVIDDSITAEPARELQSRLVLVAQIGILLIGLAGLAAAIWYFSRPPTADDLFAAIAVAAKDGKVEDLRTVEAEIDRFLKEFPQDDRAAEVVDCQKAIELDRIERGLRDRARIRRGKLRLTPIEQMYVDALRNSESEPHTAIADLEAILYLYDVDEQLLQSSAKSLPAAHEFSQENNVLAATPKTLDTLRLITRRLDALRVRVSEERTNQMPELDMWIQRAREAEEDDSQRAVKIYRAIIQLYADKSWAQDALANVRQQIDNLSSEESTSTALDPDTDSSDL